MRSTKPRPQGGIVNSHRAWNKEVLQLLCQYNRRTNFSSVIYIVHLYSRIYQCYREDQGNPILNCKTIRLFERPHIVFKNNTIIVEGHESVGIKGPNNTYSVSIKMNSGSKSIESRRREDIRATIHRNLNRKSVLYFIPDWWANKTFMFQISASEPAKIRAAK